MNEDSGLREQFQSLRRAEEARSPSFDAVLGRAQRASAARFGGLAAVVAVVIAVMAVVVLQVARRPAFRADGGPAPMLADWRAPTDFLLDTPGQTLLHTVPEFGRYPSAVPTAFPPTRNTTPAHRAGREHS